MSKSQPGNIAPIDVDWLRTEFWQAMEKHASESGGRFSRQALDVIVKELDLVLKKVAVPEAFTALLVFLEGWIDNFKKQDQLRDIKDSDYWVGIFPNSQCFDESWEEGNPFEHNWVFGELIEQVLLEYRNRPVSWTTEKPAKFLNFYNCPYDGEKWTCEGDSMHNDRCPECNCEIEPDRSEDLINGGIKEMFHVKLPEPGVPDRNGNIFTKAVLDKVFEMHNDGASDASIVAMVNNGPVTDERVEKAADEAQQAFWSEIVNHFPEVRTGDYPPDATFEFDAAIETALRRWLSYNHPLRQENDDD